MLDLAPHLIFVIHVIVQFHHHDAHAVLTLCGGFHTVHLTKSKQIALQWSSHLLFYLLAGGTRVDGYYHTLSDGSMRKLILWHDVHAVDTHHKQDAYDKQ